MTRRGLLGALLGAATMDPERLLWVPGAKVISIPKPVVQRLVYSVSVMEPGDVFTIAGIYQFDVVKGERKTLRQFKIQGVSSDACGAVVYDLREVLG